MCLEKLTAEFFSKTEGLGIFRNISIHVDAKLFLIIASCHQIGFPAEIQHGQ